MRIPTAMPICRLLCNAMLRLVAFSLSCAAITATNRWSPRVAARSSVSSLKNVGWVEPEKKTPSWSTSLPTGSARPEALTRVPSTWSCCTRDTDLRSEDHRTGSGDDCAGSPIPVPHLPGRERADCIRWMQNRVEAQGIRPCALSVQRAATSQPSNAFAASTARWHAAPRSGSPMTSLTMLANIRASARCVTTVMVSTFGQEPT
jgi:hypothetical protein